MGLERRVARLEQSAKRWRLVSIAASTAALAAILIGAAGAEKPDNPDWHKIVQCRGLAIVDEKGRAVGQFVRSDDGTQVNLLVGRDDDGHAPIVLQSARDAALVFVNKKDGNNSIIVGDTADGRHACMIDAWKNFAHVTVGTGSDAGVVLSDRIGDGKIEAFGRDGRGQVLSKDGISTTQRSN